MTTPTTPRDRQGNPRPTVPRTILITGCSSGIGYTCAHALAARGWHDLTCRIIPIMRRQGHGRIIRSRFRANAHRAFKAAIDPERSAHRDAYRRAEVRLTKEGPAQPFTLPPEAVLAKLIHALEAPRPRPRYYVTFPTHLMGTLRRVLSSRGLDWVIRRISGDGER